MWLNHQNAMRVDAQLYQREPGEFLHNFKPFRYQK